MSTRTIQNGILFRTRQCLFTLLRYLLEKQIVIGKVSCLRKSIFKIIYSHTTDKYREVSRIATFSQLFPNTVYHSCFHCQFGQQKKQTSGSQRERERVMSSELKSKRSRSAFHLVCLVSTGLMPNGGEKTQSVSFQRVSKHAFMHTNTLASEARFSR